MKAALFQGPERGMTSDTLKPEFSIHRRYWFWE